MSAGRGCVALTGGTGFLGAHMVSALVAAGWRVRLLARRPGPQMPGTERVTGTLFDSDVLDRLLDGAHVLVHAAGLIKATSRNDFLRVNRDGSRQLAEAVARRAPMRVVMVSSLAAREPALSDYAFSKSAGEDAFRQWAPDDLVIVRPCAVYGQGDRETAVFLTAADGPVIPIPRLPHGRVTLIHASDVGAAIASLCAPGPRGETYELSDGRMDGYGWRELADEIRAAANSSARILEIPAGPFRAIAVVNAAIARISGRSAMLSPGKVREMFHPDWSSAEARQPPPDVWRPAMTLKDGLAQTVQWLRQARTVQAYTGEPLT